MLSRPNWNLMWGQVPQWVSILDCNPSKTRGGGCSSNRFQSKCEKYCETGHCIDFHLSFNLTDASDVKWSQVGPQNAPTLSAQLPCMPDSEVTPGGGSEAIGTQGIILNQILALIDPSDKSFGLRLPCSGYPRSPCTQASETMMLVMLWRHL